LREALGSNDSPQVLFAVERLCELDPDAVREALPRLAKHRSPRVRALAFRLTHDLGQDATDGSTGEKAAELARSGISDADATVRVAALEALAAQLKEDAHDELLAYAERKDDEAVRTGAIAALLRHCGLDGLLDGAPRLCALLESDAPAERIAAARVLGMVGEASLARSLMRLLGDADADVRRAAIAAASNVRDPRLLPVLIGALAERTLAAAASKAISALGDEAIAELAACLADEKAPRLARLKAPRVLARLESRAALAVLLSRLDERDEAVRQKVLASASRLRLAIQAPAVPFVEIHERVDREMVDHAQTRDDYIAVRPLVLRPLLDEYAIRRLRKGLIRILRLFELAFPREVVASIRAHLFGADPALRANAFEVLESLLDPALRVRLIDLVERFIRLSMGAFPEPPLGPRMAYAAAWLHAEIASPDPYRAAIALDAIAAHRVLGAGADALAATKHADPLVREAAAVAVLATKPLGAEQALVRLRDDEDAVVAAYARYCTETKRTGIELDEGMYTTIEKVLFLQRVPVFSRVAGDDLAPLARGSVVMPLLRRDVVFREGDPGGALYFVISGAVILTVSGREVARLGPNDVFGEMSIFDREPRAVTALASEDTELLRVSADDFREAVRETVEIAEAVIQVLNRRLREADRRLAAARARLSAPDATEGERATTGHAVNAPGTRPWDGETIPPGVDDADLE
jgi:HEAT repeat protein